MKFSLTLILFFIIILGCEKPTENQSNSIYSLDNLFENQKKSNLENQIEGHWKCSANEIGINKVFELEFLEKKVIFKDFTGMVRNTNFEINDTKILFGTGDVLQIKDDSTLIFPMPIPQFNTTINCICKQTQNIE